ncbi:hypothetical protein [Vibrio hepatarius]|uniref:hypothetical protein n=1 Tax=Vibrio hepatarius TaxID=171383 RepID=UPI001C091D63|nr:hypothetical protein [Vibrio hepatarius]MBU2895655.1 hypothetical protein [Vibrio hepatarius]
MHKMKVSRRYGNLFVASVIHIDSFGERKVFPQSKIPIVFRTDATARMIAKMALKAEVSDSEQEKLSLFVEGCLVCSSTKEVLEEVVSLWKKQSVSIGVVEIKNEVVQKHNDEAGSDIVLKAIYRNGI